MADRIGLSVRTGHFSCTDGTSPDSPWSVELNPPIQDGLGRSDQPISTYGLDLHGLMDQSGQSWSVQTLLLRVGNRAAGTCVASSPDSDLDAFSQNPVHGSFAPLAFQPSAMTNCANQRFLSY
ncbi:hypothetical protein N665_2619s0001 [Sinapis alba]|nr:hypothetical protein N665_2619s0001 [Sinapis alba]